MLLIICVSVRCLFCVFLCLLFVFQRNKNLVFHAILVFFGVMWAQTMFPILFLDLDFFCCVFGFLFLEVGVLSVLSFLSKGFRVDSCLFWILYVVLRLHFFGGGIFVGLSFPIKKQSRNPGTRKKSPKRQIIVQLVQLCSQTVFQQKMGCMQNKVLFC